MRIFDMLNFTSEENVTWVNLQKIDKEYIFWLIIESSSCLACYTMMRYSNTNLIRKFGRWSLIKSKLPNFQLIHYGKNSQKQNTIYIGTQLRAHRARGHFQNENRFSVAYIAVDLRGGVCYARLVLVSWCHPWALQPPWLHSRLRVYNNHPSNI